MNGSQYRCINSASAPNTHTGQLSHNRDRGDTVDSPLVHLGGESLNGCTIFAERISAAVVPLCIYGPWGTPFANALNFDSDILPCTMYFYHDCTRTICKINRFGNASILIPKVNEHVFLDVGRRSVSELNQRLQCFLFSRDTLCVRSTAMCPPPPCFL